MAIRRRTVGLSLAQQAMALNQQFPDARVILRPGRLVWTGTLRPTTLSRDYQVQVTYKLGRFPEVAVLDALEGRHGEPLPHVYMEGNLCLHLTHEWTPAMFMAQSTLAWTSEWLLNYELWKFTGEWLGGGARPPLTGHGLKARKSN